MCSGGSREMHVGWYEVLVGKSWTGCVNDTLFLSVAVDVCQSTPTKNHQGLCMCSIA